MEKDLCELITYPAPAGAVRNPDYTVRVRTAQEEWQELFTYNVKVDMHHVRNASMVYFDCSGQVEMEVIRHAGSVHQAVLRPVSCGLSCEVEGSRVTFLLDGPGHVSLELDGDRFHNLHIFANPLEEHTPDPSDPDVIYFGPGLHVLDDPVLRVPSGTTVYIAGGAVVWGGLLCEHAENVTIRGRGILYLSGFAKETYHRALQITFSRNIVIEGIIAVDPPHYTLLIGQSEHVTVRNLKTFSTRGWSDGIDIMSSSHILIDRVFLRTSDDCIAIYGHRWDYYGDSRDIHVRRSVLWADVAHPINIGTHGSYEGDGDIMENMSFEDLDILEHHEPQPDYWGCIAINPGDKNTVRKVRFENIRIEPFELGELFNIRVKYNPKYNPCPGNRIEDILFKNITCEGECPNPSRIEGYDDSRVVDGITFENVSIAGVRMTAGSGHLQVGDHVRNLTVR
ncbi:hypothetical protein J2T17_001718 [Paenibacillus mucilaginosus]|uniref:glycosyl hydrolase family 28 protein n=1 Tax=Paenibacillus mucilaginosus TaxID=61624 RepID=UPI003D20A76A